MGTYLQRLSISPLLAHVYRTFSFNTAQKTNKRKNRFYSWLWVAMGKIFCDINTRKANRGCVLLAQLHFSREELVVNTAMDAGLNSSDPAPLQDLEECLGRWVQSQGSRLQETKLGLETAMQNNPEKGEVLWRADILLKKTCQEFWNECSVCADRARISAGLLG